MNTPDCFEPDCMLCPWQPMCKNATNTVVRILKWKIENPFGEDIFREPTTSGANYTTEFKTGNSITEFFRNLERKDKKKRG